MTNYTLQRLVLYFLKLGATGFGGPLALINYMQRDLVEKLGWVSHKEYQHGLALSQIVPGPLAMQMAIYFGYLRGKTLGATLVAIVFILPSFFLVWGLSYLYVRYQGLAWLTAFSYGMGSAVIAVILQSALRLIPATLEKRKGLWLIFIAMALTTATTGEANLLYFFLSGVIAILIYAFPTSERLQSVDPFVLFFFFAKAALVIYGGGFALLAFIYQDLVEVNHWITNQQFLDAVVLGSISPGPFLIGAGAIGYFACGLPGALAATFGVFLPVYLFVIFGAPWFHKILRNRQVQVFVEGVTAAAIGAIAGAAFLLAQKTIVDWKSAGIAAASFLLIRFTKIPTALLLVLFGFVGVAILAISG
ncbi:MAG: chromate transporter [Deltaproteobacteria bacterium]|nr:chromate transporter [Deltaproteobacteria bacterium]